MATKDKLVRDIIGEFQTAQEEPWVPPPRGAVGKLRFPPLLPTGTEIQLPATDKLLQLVAVYADISFENDRSLKKAYRRSEWFEVVRRAFGEALYGARFGFSDVRLAPWLRGRVDSIIEDQITGSRRDIDLVLGCWLFEDLSLYPINVGPIEFMSREQWFERARDENRITEITYRRLVGTSPRRKRSRRVLDAQREEWLSEAVGSCPVICTIATNGLSGDLIIEKGVRAARLAMTALSLMWDRPSQGLRWMHLLFDGPVFHKRFVLFSDDRVGSGSSLSRMPSGFNQSDLSKPLERFESYFEVVGEVLADYLTPHSESTRPRVANALFLSLWWFHQACREESDQIATTKFAASLDSLAAGAGSEGILELLDARLGYKARDALTIDGRTTKQIVEKVYNASRSQLIHGSSQDFAHDWSGIRGMAERLGRDALLGACEWLSKNPQLDDIDALRLN